MRHMRMVRFGRNALLRYATLCRPHVVPTGADYNAASSAQSQSPSSPPPPPPHLTGASTRSHSPAPPSAYSETTDKTSYFPTWRALTEGHLKAAVAKQHSRLRASALRTNSPSLALAHQITDTDQHTFHTLKGKRIRGGGGGCSLGARLSPDQPASTHQTSRHPPTHPHTIVMQLAISRASGLPPRKSIQSSHHSQCCLIPTVDPINLYPNQLVSQSTCVPRPPLQQ